MYEPMRLLLPDGRDRHGSPLSLGDQLDVPGSTVVHERCYEAFDPDGSRRRGTLTGTPRASRRGAA